MRPERLFKTALRESELEEKERKVSFSNEEPDVLALNLELLCVSICSSDGSLAEMFRPMYFRYKKLL